MSIAVKNVLSRCRFESGSNSGSGNSLSTSGKKNLPNDGFSVLLADLIIFEGPFLIDV